MGVQTSHQSSSKHPRKLRNLRKPLARGQLSGEGQARVRRPLGHTAMRRGYFLLALLAPLLCSSTLFPTPTTPTSVASSEAAAELRARVTLVQATAARSAAENAVARAVRRVVMAREALDDASVKAEAGVRALGELFGREEKVYERDEATLVRGEAGKESGTPGYRPEADEESGVRVDAAADASVQNEVAKNAELKEARRAAQVELAKAKAALKAVKDEAMRLAVGEARARALSLAAARRTAAAAERAAESLVPQSAADGAVKLAGAAGVGAAAAVAGAGAATDALIPPVTEQEPSPTAKIAPGVHRTYRYRGHVELRAIQGVITDEAAKGGAAACRLHLPPRPPRAML